MAKTFSRRPTNPPWLAWTPFSSDELRYDELPTCSTASAHSKKEEEMQLSTHQHAHVVVHGTAVIKQGPTMAPYLLVFVKAGRFDVSGILTKC